MGGVKHTDVIGDVTIITPDETDADKDWMCFILPALRGQLTITIWISFHDIQDVFKDLHNTTDVLEFLDRNRPWLNVSYHFST